MKVLALFCCLMAVAGQSALMLYVVLLGLDHGPAPLVTAGPPGLVNVAWLVLFALQHSGMLRIGFKRRLSRLCPSFLERSLYAGLSGIVLIGLCATWQPISGEALWRLPWWTLMGGVAGAAGSLFCCTRFDQATFFGLRQVWLKQDCSRDLQITGCYRFIRHPIMASLLVFLWCQPIMTPTLLFLSGGMSLYIALGILLEERDMIRRFGPAYEAYRRRVPTLIPWRKPTSPGSYPEISIQGRL